MKRISISGGAKPSGKMSLPASPAGGVRQQSTIMRAPRLKALPQTRNYGKSDPASGPAPATLGVPLGPDSFLGSK